MVFPSSHLPPKRSAQSMKPNPFASLKDRIRPLYLPTPSDRKTWGFSLDSCVKQRFHAVTPCPPNGHSLGTGFGIVSIQHTSGGAQQDRHGTGDKNVGNLRRMIQRIHHNYNLTISCAESQSRDLFLKFMTVMRRYFGLKKSAL